MDYIKHALIFTWNLVRVLLMLRRIAVFGLSLLISYPLFASQLKPNLQLEQMYGYDLQQEPETEDRYRLRLSADFPLDSNRKSLQNCLSGFFEFRYNFDLNRIDHEQIGLAFLTSLHHWIQWKQSLQQAILPSEKNRLETESSLLLNIPPPTWKWKINLYVLEEYTYALTLGEATDNEFSAGLRIPLKKLKTTLLLGWHHLDRIHQFDSDFLELGLQL